MMRAGRARPVFVLGTARSGTTWLANLLADHPSIAAVVHAAHQGIHESHLLSHTRYVFPERLTMADFLAHYRREDYFRLLGLDADTLAAAYAEPGAVPELFRHLMDEFAAARGATHWLEKTPKHCLYVDELARWFPDAVFVMIEREFRSTLLSHVNKYARPGAPPWLQVTEKVVRYETDMRCLARCQRRAPVPLIRIRYEDLVADTDAVTARIQDFLGLPIRRLASRFPADSSFAAGVSRFRFGPGAWRSIEMLRAAVHIAPLAPMLAVRRRRDRAAAAAFPKFQVIST